MPGHRAGRGSLPAKPSKEQAGPSAQAGGGLTGESQTPTRPEFCFQPLPHLPRQPSRTSPTFASPSAPAPPGGLSPALLERLYPQSPAPEPRAECPGKAGREGGRKLGCYRAHSPSEARAGPETPSQPRDRWTLSGTLANALNFSEPLCCHLQNGDKNAYGPEISRAQLDNVRESVPRTHSSWVSGSCS